MNYKSTQTLAESVLLQERERPSHLYYYDHWNFHSASLQYCWWPHDALSQIGFCGFHDWSVWRVAGSQAYMFGLVAQSLSFCFFTQHSNQNGSTNRFCPRAKVTTTYTRTDRSLGIMRPQVFARFTLIHVHDLLMSVLRQPSLQALEDRQLSVAWTSDRQALLRII